MQPGRCRERGVVGAALVLATLAACSSYAESEAPPVAGPAIDAGNTDVPGDAGADTAAPLDANDTRYPDAVRASSPSLYYRLDEADATHAAVDVITPLLDGATAVGTVPSTPGALAGNADPARRFDNGHLELTRGFDTSGQARFTFEAWVKLDSLLSPGIPVGVVTNDALLISGHAGGAALTIELAADNTNRLVFERRDASTAGSDESAFVSRLEGGVVTGGVWHHVVATFGALELTLYLDGVRVQHATTVVTAGPTNGALFIGARRRDPTLRFPGAIDEVALYALTLGAADVAAHHAAGRPRK